MDSVLRAAVLQDASVWWTDEMHETFVDLVTALISAPAFGMPDYSPPNYNLPSHNLPSHLYVSEREKVLPLACWCRNMDVSIVQ